MLGKRFFMGSIAMERSPYWLLICLAFLGNLWELSTVNLKTFQYVHLAIFAFFFITIIGKSYGLFRNLVLDKWVLAMMLLPLLSIPACKVLHGQSIASSLVVYRMHLGWLIFFVLWKKKVTETQLVYAIIFMASVYTVIVLGQQLTGAAFAPFGGRTFGTGYTDLIAGGVEKRFGFYRFAVGGSVFAVFALILYVSKKWRANTPMLILMILGIVATGSRHEIAGAFCAVAYYYLFGRQVRYRYLYILLIIASVWIVTTYGEVLFGSLSHVSDDLEEGRAHSYIYYWGEITKNPLAFLCGNGLAASASKYSLNADQYFMDKPITPSDIGLVGTWYYWGGIYVFTYVLMSLRLLLSKHLSVYLKAIIVYFLAISWVVTPLWEITAMTVQGFLLYYCELDIQNNKNNSLTDVNRGGYYS